MQKKSKARKKKAKNKSPKKQNFKLARFVYKYKLPVLIAIAIFSGVFYLKKGDLSKPKENIISEAPKTTTSKYQYSEAESKYLKELRAKYSGNGRQVSVNDTKKAINNACIYIARVQGQSFWNTENAKDLLLATAVVESDLRARYSQYGGNAVGIFQIEYITFKDFWHRSIPKSYPKLYAAMKKDFGDIDFEMIQNNDMLGAIFARLVYSRAKTKIPYKNDVSAQAKYYKTHYNTHEGKGKTSTFMKKKSNIHKLK